MPTAKEAAKQVIDRLPDQASWADILYDLYVKQKIEAGLPTLDTLRRLATALSVDGAVRFGG